MKTSRNTYAVYIEGIPVVRRESDGRIGEVIARGTSLLESDRPEANAAYIRKVIGNPRGHIIIDGRTFEPLPSRTAAKRQAHQESSMYRQGSGWIVSTWDEDIKCYRNTGELPYQIAKTRLAEWRRERAAELRGEVAAWTATGARASSAVATIAAVAEAIRELGEVPAGHLYAQLLGHLSLEEFQLIVRTLKGAELVEERSNVLTWIGPLKGAL